MGVSEVARVASGAVLMLIGSVTERLRQHPPVKHYRIGEVSRYSGLSRQTVHNYTIMGLISETEWTPGGHRLYPEDVFDRLVRIEQLKASRTLREIRHLLHEEAVVGDAEPTDASVA